MYRKDAPHIDEPPKDLVQALDVADSGIEVVSKYRLSDAKRLRAIEDENRKLKKLLAEHMLEIAAIRDVLGKKW